MQSVFCMHLREVVPGTCHRDPPPFFMPGCGSLDQVSPKTDVYCRRARKPDDKKEKGVRGRFLCP